MKSFIAIAAFAAGTNALVGRSDSCCFHLTASGGVSGTLGQLSDGQVRVGDDSLSAATFCINSSGAITDSAGRGCILTTETTQFQCDTGATATSGFSITSSGELEYHGSPNFIACETGENGGRNIYTTNSTSVTMCKKVELTADSCSGSGAGASSSSMMPSSSSMMPSASQSSVMVAPSSSAPAPSSSAPAPSSPAPAPSSPVSSNSASSAPAPSAATLWGSPIYVTSTVTVTDCSCPNNTPGFPAPSGSAPSGSAQPSGAAGGSTPSASAAPSPSESSVPSPSSPSGSAQPSGPAGGSTPSASAAPSLSESSVPSPSSLSSSAQPSGPAAGASTAASSPAQSPVPTTSSMVVPSSSTSASSSSTTSSMVVPSSSTSASSSSTAATATQSSAGSCATTLISGEYQYPHLIIPINSSSPDTAYGTQYFGTVSETVSTIFNFDIPSSYEGSTCNLLFMFPEKADLETSDYTFSGNGKIDFSKLSEVASSSTTYNNAPSVSENLGDITITPGNTYVVSTFSCPAGETVAYEMSEAGTTYLNWFNDWNPSPLGVFITKC
ncbi:hypothetical protein N7520_006288 [Penicillium odoratum]|uniref:uncharacterized protein n=1 Tax=Penicillium odoratum TaxID=1167516 RepID=UPI0025491718|nr:uncharacterized protein N7520_006288 [Penicillium odoratum]KAJ5759132.1 hypothetical protein N7520_006288 [Penicillium odoratum]